MDLDIEQLIDGPIGQVVELYSSAEFFTSLPPSERIATPEPVLHERRGDIVTLHLRYRFTGDLPSAAKRFVEADKLTWVEQTRIDLAARTSRSQLVADNYASLLNAAAAADFADAPAPGSTPRTRRTVTGTLSVRVPLFGGRVEGAIVDGLREHLANEAAAASATLNPNR